MNTYLIEEKPIGPYRSAQVRTIQGTDVRISKGVLQIWELSPSSEAEPHLVSSVALERILNFKMKEAAEQWDGVDRRTRPRAGWDGSERRGRPIPIWDGVERRAS